MANQNPSKPQNGQPQGRPQGRPGQGGPQGQKRKPNPFRRPEDSYPHDITAWWGAADPVMKRRMWYARDPFARVLIPRTTETHMLVDLLLQADKGLKNYKDKALTRLDSEAGTAIVQEFIKSSMVFSEAAAKMCAFVGLQYQDPFNGVNKKSEAGKAKKSMAAPAPPAPTVDSPKGEEAQPAAAAAGGRSRKAS